MHTFQAGQPALLYLSPACVGSVVICALLRGETAELWGFVDGESTAEKEAELVEGGVAVAGSAKAAEVEAAGEATGVETGRSLRSRTVAAKN